MNDNDIKQSKRKRVFSWNLSIYRFDCINVLVEEEKNVNVNVNVNVNNEILQIHIAGTHCELFV